MSGDIPPHPVHLHDMMLASAQGELYLYPLILGAGVVISCGQTLAHASLQASRSVSRRFPALPGMAQSTGKGRRPFRIFRMVHTGPLN